MCILFVKIIQMALHVHCHRVETQFELINVNSKFYFVSLYLSKHLRQMRSQ